MNLLESSGDAIQLVTPDVDGGVLDYTYLLKEALGSRAEVYRLSRGSESEWDVRGKDVVLQFSGYGYQKRGVPFWLLRSVRRRKDDMRSFGVFFHELFAADGKFWQSSFYLAPAQRYICRELLILADFWFTNRTLSADWLRRHCDTKPSAVLRTFSNVGELDAPERVREPWVVFFGGAGLRAATYLKAPHVLVWARTHGYRVHDVGTPIVDGSIQEFLRRENVVQHGRLDASAISGLLAAARFGVVAYPVDYVAKSGVFAAFAAHAVCPVLASDVHQSVDGLTPRGTYLAADAFRQLSARNAADAADKVGQQAWQWYQDHRIHCHALRLLEFIA